MKAIIQENDFKRLTAYFGLSGKWCLPEVPPLSDELYVEARDSWMNAGMAEMDFDGSLKFVRPYNRLFYNLVNPRGGLLYEDGQVCLRFLRGPVDLLMIETSEDGKTYTLSLKPNVTVNDALLEKWSKSSAGSVSAYREPGGQARTVSVRKEELSSPDHRLRLLQFFFVEV